MGGGYILCLLILMNFFSLCNVAWIQIYRLLEYPLYFFLGYKFENSGNRVKTLTYIENNKNMRFLLTIGLLTFTFFLTMIIEVVSMPVLLIHAIGILQALLGSMLLYTISVMISTKEKIYNSKCMSCLKDNNFSIYLYHEPLQFLLLWVLCKLNLAKYFNNNFMYIVLFILRFFITIVVAIMIGKSVEKIKAKF